jgi:anhydro-N-acetylmuramic acid kinase
MNPMTRLKSITEKSSRRIIGLMSGMSMDGINLALVQISGAPPNLTAELLESHNASYSPETQQALLRGRDTTVADVSSLNFLVAREFAECVRDFLKSKKIDPGSIDAIGSHGQTLFHQTLSGKNGNSTFQVGSPSIIAELTGITTIGNFRYRDVAAGGHGAPLVAYADYLLHATPGSVVVLNNLGSISNVTVVGSVAAETMAFDTGPANLIIDYFVRRLTNGQQSYDRDGTTSSRGRVIDSMLKELLQNPYYAQMPPKAAGYQDFLGPQLDAMLQAVKGSQTSDIVMSAVELSAATIADAYRKFILPKWPRLEAAKFSGGGTRNPTLMRRIRELLPEVKIEVFDARYSDAKEAMAFAILANETLCGRPSNLPSATGAGRSVVLGEIAL